MIDKQDPRIKFKKLPLDEDLVLNLKSNDRFKDYPTYHNLLRNLKLIVGDEKQTIDSFEKIIHDKYVDSISVAEHIVENDQAWKRFFDNKKNRLYLTAKRILERAAIEDNYFSKTYFLKTGKYFGLSNSKIEKIILNSPKPIETALLIRTSAGLGRKISHFFKPTKLISASYDARFQLEQTYSFMNKMSIMFSKIEDYNKKVELAIDEIPNEVSANDILIVSEYLSDSKPKEFKRLSFAYTASKEFLRRSNY